MESIDSPWTPFILFLSLFIFITKSMEFLLVQNLICQTPINGVAMFEFMILMGQNWMDGRRRANGLVLMRKVVHIGFTGQKSGQLLLKEVSNLFQMRYLLGKMYRSRGRKS